MKLEYVKGSITDVVRGLVVHGCNAQGKMASGVAKNIVTKWPRVYKDYSKLFTGFVDNEKLLGNVVITSINEELKIASGITQYNYGNDGRRYVNYEAMTLVFEKCEGIAGMYGLNHIFIPRIGAGLGGGNWKIISTIIEETIKDIDVTVVTPEE